MYALNVSYLRKRHWALKKSLTIKILIQFTINIFEILLDGKILSVTFNCETFFKAHNTEINWF